jgi:hypothetical protein
LIINHLLGGLYEYDLAEKHDVPMMLASVIPLSRTSKVPLMGFSDVSLPHHNK